MGKWGLGCEFNSPEQLSNTNLQMAGRGEKRDLVWRNIVWYVIGSLKKKSIISLKKKQFISKLIKKELQLMWVTRKLPCSMFEFIEDEENQEINLALIKLQGDVFHFHHKSGH